MPYFPITGDITKMETDAIVNAANESLLGGGGVDGAIHAAAGPELVRECRTLGGCRTGEAKITRGYNLKAKYVIHTVGPVYQGGAKNEEALLRSCYRSSLRLAAEHGLSSVAFPLISAGVYGYPKREAVRVAEEEIRSFLGTNEMTVYLVFYNKTEFSETRTRHESLEERISRALRVKSERESRRMEDESDVLFCKPCLSVAPSLMEEPRIGGIPAGTKRAAAAEGGLPLEGKSLDEVLKERDESFREMLFRCIDARGMKDSDCYHRANIDRKLFSKIRSDEGYKPSKPTVAALAVGLGLDLRETKELFKKAGFALNRSSTFDIIVGWFIEKGIYDIYEINNELLGHDQPCLGNVVA